jgi:hypothetical protein
MPIPMSTAPLRKLLIVISAVLKNSLGTLAGIGAGRSSRLKNWPSLPARVYTED